MSFNINKFAVSMRTAFLFIFLSVYSLGLAQNEHLSSFSSLTLTYKTVSYTHLRAHET